MNLFRIIFCYRRRRRYQFCLLILIILLISSYICVCWIEISSDDNDIEIFKKEIKEFENDNLVKQNPIFSKYIQNPYNINLWNIINEANRKYQEKENKYLVYSCPFMCGGKNLI